MTIIIIVILVVEVVVVILVVIITKFIFVEGKCVTHYKMATEAQSQQTNTQ